MFNLLKDPRALALLLAASLTILSNTLISPALPGLEAHFAGQPNAGLLTRLLVTAPSLLVAISASFAGLMADRFGRRRQLLAGVVLFALAGSAGLWLPSLALILGSRLVLGLAVALIMTAQTALIGDYFEGAARSRFMGIQLAATNFGGLIFLLLSGWLAEWSPFAPFAIYAVALLYLPLLLIALPEPAPRDAKMQSGLDDSAGEEGWHLSLATLVVLSVVSMVCFYILPTQAPYFLAQIGSPEPSTTALFLAVMTFAGGMTSLVFGRVRERLGRAKTSALGFAAFAAGFVVLAFATGLSLALVGAAIIGVATGFILPIFLSTALDLAPSHRRGMAAGATTTSIFLGQFLSPLLSEPLIHAIGFSKVFGIVAAALALLGIVSLFVFREREAAVRS